MNCNLKINQGRIVQIIVLLPIICAFMAQNRKICTKIAQNTFLSKLPTWKIKVTAIPEKRSDLHQGVTLPCLGTDESILTRASTKVAFGFTQCRFHAPSRLFSTTRMNSWSCSLEDITRCPLIRHQVGISFSTPGSVQVISTLTPDSWRLMLSCRRITGIGQSSLRASTFMGSALMRYTISPVYHQLSWVSHEPLLIRCHGSYTKAQHCPGLCLC